jgi:hypothetical protein
VKNTGIKKYKGSERMGHHHRKSKEKYHWLKYVIFMAAFAIMAVGVSLYLLPFVAYYQVESAISSKDAEKLAAATGFSDMRRNLKAQRGQRVIKTLKKDDNREVTLVDLSIMWSALATDGEVDRAISTEGFYVALSTGAATGKPNPIKPAQDLSLYQMVRHLIDKSSFQYQSLSKFIVNVRDEKGRYSEYFTYVFTRDGFNWRLTNVILPVV